MSNKHVYKKFHTGGTRFPRSFLSANSLIHIWNFGQKGLIFCQNVSFYLRSIRGPKKRDVSTTNNEAYLYYIVSLTYSVFLSKVNNTWKCWSVQVWQIIEKKYNGMYRIFHRFMQAKFTNSRSILSFNQFLLLP